MTERAAHALDRFVFPGTDPDTVEAYRRIAETALETSWGFEEEVAYLDIETTGFDPARDHIIEVAVAIGRGPEVSARYSTLVDPGVEIPREATQLTGIDDAMVAGAPPIAPVVSELADVIGGRDIVAHNSRFDESFVLEAAGRAGKRLPGRWLDSLELARIGLPRMRSHRLRDLAEAFGLPPAGHRAEADVAALFGVWRVSLAGVAALPLEVLDRICAISPDTEWALRRTLSHMAAAGRAPRTFDLKRARADRVRGHRPPGLADADGRELVCPPADEVLAEFDAAGAVGRMYPGFETRSEQLRMAEEVLGAFGEGRHAAIEAGTGVGKSVAYLVPAALYAMRNDLGVGVATKTNTLMDQLVYGELPALSSQLGGKLRYAGLKGYDHYLCLRKLDSYLVAEEALTPESVANIAAVVAWVAQTSWGDVHSVNVHWGPERSRLTSRVEECASKRCRFYPDLCYLHGVRRLASSAHVVVTNHALLFRDAAAAGGILPPLRHWIVDEAHGAEAEARRQLSVCVDHQALRGLLAALHAPGRGGAVDAARGKGRALAMRREDESLAARIESATTAMRADLDAAATVAESFFDFAKDLGEGVQDGYDTVEMRVTPQLRESGTWGYVSGTGHSLARRLESVIAAGRTLLTALEEAGEEADEVRGDLAGLLSRLSEQLFGLETVLDGSDDSFVYSVKVASRRDESRDVMEASMLDVGAALAERLYPEVRSVVFTSATIATGEDFSHFERTVGLDRLDAGRWNTLRLDSSYDFDRQMAVFVPSDLPVPEGRAHLRPLADLIEQVHLAMGGSVLTLFTNQREMAALYDEVAPRLEPAGLRLLLQGRGVSTKRVLDEFLSDERVSLFATRSFWEGFDAPGDTLRCVVVARLPFGRMHDPLYLERQERYGSRAWREFYLPEAVLDLKQAAGRLIRSATDEGCVIVADGRLASGKSYARDFLEALPVADVEVLTSAEIAHNVRERFGG